MATIRAYVYKQDGIFDSYRVFPPVVILGKNDEFELVNVTDKDADLKIPAGPFGEPISETVKKNGKHSTPKKPKDGLFVVEYEVKVDGKKAEGNSDPVIIIDPA